MKSKFYLSTPEGRNEHFDYLVRGSWRMMFIWKMKRFFRIVKEESWRLKKTK